MGKLAVYKYVATMFLVIQMVVSVFTLVGLFGGDVTPVGNAARAISVYMLPLLIAANGVLLLYWLIRRRWLLALIPILTIACCIPYIGTLYQFRFDDPKENTQSGLKIASYNVAMFGRETSGFMAQDILAEMRRQKVDILCMQEYNETSGDKKNSDSYKEYFPYMQTGREDMVIYSRYPITANKTILFEETNNSAMWADIDVNGTEYRVFNVHLETTGINRTLHKAGKLMMQNHEIDNNRLFDAIYGNYMMGMMFRSGQAITIANEKRESDKPVILCGDLNVAHTEIDLKNPKTNHHNAGFTDEERGKFDELLAAGFVDTFRELHPDATGAYTWWSYLRKARLTNAGWRIDYFVTSARLKEQLAAATIHSDIYGSDHCPVGLELRR